MDVSDLFLPSRDRAVEFDRLIRERLAGSLGYLAEVTEGSLHASQDPVAKKLKWLRENPVLPEVFAAYHELVPLVEDGRLQEAGSLFEEILNSIGKGTSFLIIPFKNPAEDEISSRYLKQVTSDSSTKFNIVPATDEDFIKATRMIGEAMELIHESCPDLHGEISALLKRVMVGAGPTEKGAFTFDGASAFSLWGAILLNALTQKDVVDMAQTLAHESCHNLLFGYCIEGLLVENSDEERHASPLRADPRPLDGIFHATFVLARIHYCLEKITASPLLSEELKSKAKNEKKRQVPNFYDGLSTLKAHARYTEDGKALMDAAEAYMDRSARI